MGDGHNRSYRHHRPRGCCTARRRSGGIPDGFESGSGAGRLAWLHLRFLEHRLRSQDPGGEERVGFLVGTARGGRPHCPGLVCRGVSRFRGSRFADDLGATDDLGSPRVATHVWLVGITERARRTPRPSRIHTRHWCGRRWFQFGWAETGARCSRGRDCGGVASKGR